ncbi:helix-hairpin-helix domain-containing protein [Flavobacterium sp. H122]|uniref:helix-hairpin-helix domain-containing protein n=1 Tax=Flavobacterium sp. H122 TaxID=2529860 RepID=UPI0010A9BCC6|nr:helix-hairpin-helix domain-containing protein [Flavobacterium sp. H122]
MDFKEYFKYTRDQRIALLLLIALMVVVQLIYSFADFTSTAKPSKEENEWLALQSEIDSLKSIMPKSGYKMYPFNPNFITDFRGYKLGMSVAEIDRLLEYRKTGKFVNSVEEFQKITKVSNELLEKIAPYFKFPDWVKNKKNNYETYFKSGYKPYEKEVKKIIVQDINSATKEDFMKIFGIGDAISERIVKQREIFGGFISMEQLQDVWGLSPEVLYELNKNFKIGTTPVVSKIEINNASTKELMKLPYFRYALAREIVTYRSMNGAIKSIEDLIKIKGFPVEKVKIIALYLDFK